MFSVSRLLTEPEVAELLGRSERALQLDRHKGCGLPYVKIGRLVRYKPADIEAYIDEHTERPATADDEVTQ